MIRIAPAPTPNDFPASTTDDISGDLMTGAAEISLFVFNDDSPPAVRRTRHLIDKRIIPAFKLGGIVAARRSKVKRAIETLEEAAAEDR
jgi:hypothetical protein